MAIKPDYFKNGTEVYIDKNDTRDFDYFVRKFNKKVQKHKVLVLANEKRFYEKPCDKRNRKKRECILRTKKEALKAEKEKVKFRKIFKNQDDDFSEDQNYEKGKNRYKTPFVKKTSKGRDPKERL